jgi:ESS family glutamate:Na+ symporter
MTVFDLDFYGTFVATTGVLLFGRLLVDKVKPLKTYSIPEPVAGGLAAALAILLLHSAFGVQVRWDMSRLDQFMLMFFASIGLNADIASLRRGGKKLGLFLVIVLGLLVVQNMVGVSIASLLGLNPATGLLGGSISLSGGHGTGAAWGQVFAERYGMTSAKEMALACATFGLVLGGLVGGPLSRVLIERVQRPNPPTDEPRDLTTFEQPKAERKITTEALIETVALFAICLAGGSALSSALQGGLLELPSFVCVLLIGVILRNLLSALKWYSVFERAVSVLGNFSLALFLGMALMSLRLWELSELALPILVLLGAQALVMVAYAGLVTFRLMGADYDAAVLAAGHCGFGLGATPTAIANMQAVTNRFGASPIAFLLVPIVGAFFLDIANAIVVKLFLLLPIYGG